MTRPILALVFAIVFVASVVVLVVRVAVPRDPPALPLSAADAPLTTHLLLIVVDGLRYDVATDSARMPHFAAAMNRETSARITAGRVSMTTTGVLAIGAGEWGELEQVVRNMWPRPAAYDSWLENAARRGRRIAAVGDPAWVRMYGQWLAASHEDPVHLAVDADFTDVTFGAARRLAGTNPDVLIVHFVTPDHQGHAWGIESARYAAFMRQYDASLDEFLRGFDRHWTVIVTSDHGATLTGTHGTDTPDERQVPIYAYGPGIRAGVRPTRPIEQIDLADTIAALLGVELPAQGLGRPMAPWLDVPRDAAQRLERAASERTSRYAAANHGASDSLPWGGVMALVAIGAIVAGCALHDVPRMVWVGAAALVASAVWLVHAVELLGGHGPDVVRSVNLAALNGLALVGVWRREHLVRWLEPRRAAAGLLLPAILAVTYPGYLQPESFVTIVVAAVLIWIAGESSSRTWLLAVVGLVALLSPLGSLQEPYGNIPLEHPTLVRLLAAAALGAWMLGRGFSFRAIALMLVPLWTRSLVPAPAGWTLIVACAGAAALAALGGRWRAAAAYLMASYLWVSRDIEIPAVAALLLVADLLATRLAESRPATTRSDDVVVYSLAGLLFAFIFLLRIGVQTSLDFGGMDWRAAAFDDAQTPLWTIVSGIAWKHISVTVLLAATVLAPFCRGFAARVVAALLGAFALRSVTLVLMLLLCRTSYWTMLRVISDLPHALIGLLVAAAAWLVTTCWSDRRGVVPV